MRCQFLSSLWSINCILYFSYLYSKHIWLILFLSLWLTPLHHKHFNRKGVFKIKLHYNPIFSLFIFPHAGPDIKYLLGFIRTQLSTTTTIALVFGPKVVRVLRGQGDQWDNRAKVRGITASFSLNGIGLVQEDSPDLYQENEELKVCFIIL